MTFEGIVLDPNVEDPDSQIIDAITQFREDISTFESQNKLPFLLFQDGKSEAYYLECHIQASDAIPVLARAHLKQKYSNKIDSINSKSILDKKLILAHSFLVYAIHIHVQL